MWRRLRPDLSAVGELCGRGGGNACCWPVQFARQVQRDNAEDQLMRGLRFENNPRPRIGLGDFKAWTAPEN